MLGKILFCPQPPSEHRRRPQSCTGTFTNHHSFILCKGLAFPQPPAQASGPAGETGSIKPPHAVPASRQVKTKEKSLIPACQHQHTEQCLFELLPLVFSLSHVGCIDSESFGSELTSSVTSGWGLLCCRCCEGICLPQIMFSHLVSSPEAQDSAASDYISRVILHLLTLSTLLPVLQPFLPPLATLLLPLRPSGHPHSPVCIPLRLPCLPPIIAPNRPCFSAETRAITYSSPQGAASQGGARPFSLLLCLRWLVTLRGLHKHWSRLRDLV